MIDRYQEHAELIELLEQLCEERLDSAQAERLEELVLSDREARQLYLEYLNLHGGLFWDAAVANGKAHAQLTSAIEQSSPVRIVSHPRTKSDRLPWVAWTAAAAVLVMFGWLIFDRPQNPQGPPDVVDTPPPTRTDIKPQPGPKEVVKKPTPPGPVVVDRQPIKAPIPGVGPEKPLPPLEKPKLAADIVAFIDARLKESWDENGIRPSQVASDAEWMRRVYLDVVGHIPPSDEVEQFLANRAPDKRTQLVEELLDRPEYARHMATIWTNLLIGRRQRADSLADRGAFFAYLQRSFGRNQPWSTTVAQLIGAEGSITEEPAGNFLVAHLNDQAVPATALVSRIFLGTQVQCAQCHDHPLIPSMKQEAFWKFNGFFKGTRIVRKKVKDETGKLRTIPVLTTRVKDQAGLTFFENRRGEMKAVMPSFEKFKLPEDYSGKRREKLAEVLTRGSRSLVAKAFVNRVWAQLLGAGFTRPIDDLGPHNPASHPEILDELTREFIKSRYDIKQLVRWITASRAYQLTSRKHADNEVDAPEIGNMPLFSRAYVKPMSPEQVYDSLILAGSKSHTPQNGWKKARELRETWIRQFVHTYETEENDESSLFDGTIPQALQMMNGDLVQEALVLKEGTFLHQTTQLRRTLETKVHRLALAALSRRATPREIAAVKAVARQRLAAMPRKDIAAAQQMALQDIFWAYLNSSEFVLVH